MNCIGIIPARYASSRFPGKPLAHINGKSMVRHVFERTTQALDHTLVATDDERIFKEVVDFGGEAIMTSPDHQSGTDRCNEAYTLYCNKKQLEFSVIVNIQGDEPFINPNQIKTLLSCFDDPKTNIATLVRKINSTEDLMDPNKPKVTIDKNGNALYFSRSAIPYMRGKDPSEWILAHNYYQHIGIYAYRPQILKQLSSLEEGTLEQIEKLEQLRWIENGFTINTSLTDYESFGIDTPEDLEKAQKLRV